MEPTQREHIQRNLRDLVSNTFVNVSVLTELQQQGMLSDNDVQELKAKHIRLEGAKLLYDYMEKRTNGYASLIKALKDTQQSGAYTILLQISSEMIENLRVGKTKRLLDHLKSDDIETIKSWINNNTSIDERQKFHEELSHTKSEMKLLRDTVPEPYPLYISRFLSRQLAVNEKLFQESCPDIFVFKNIKRFELRKFAGTHSIELAASQVMEEKITARFIILDVDKDWKRICEKSSSVPVHLLRYEETNKSFFLEQTSNIMSEALVSHLEKKENSHLNSLSEDKFVDKIISDNVKGVCICDIPGIGKTLLLKNLAKVIAEKCPESIVVFIPLPDLKLPAKTLSGKEGMSKILDYISTSQLSRHILQELITAKKLKFELLFDGLDEVNDSNLENVTYFLGNICNDISQVRIYVTSRPVHKTTLEKSLGVIAYDILPFNEDNQLEYLTSYWVSKDPSCFKIKLREYGDFCLQSFIHQLKQNEKYIAGIPLLCKLIAEIYSDKAIAFADETREYFPQLSKTFAGSLTKIYSEYIKRQFGEAECNFECIKYNFDSSRAEQCGNMACQLKCFHVWKSIQLIFPTLAEELFKGNVSFFDKLSSQKKLSLSLLEVSKNDADCNNDVKFVHRTFAEYMVAEYFATVVFSGCEAQEEQKAFQQLAFDQLFMSNRWAPEDIGHYVEATRLREKVVAYFLNDLLSESSRKNISTTCKANLSSFYNFLFILEGSIYANSHGLLHVYLAAAENQEEFEKYRRPFKQNTDDIQKELQNLAKVAAAILDVEAAEKVCNFFQKKFEINLWYVDQHWFGYLPIELAIVRGEFALTNYFANVQSLRGTIFLCVENTYFETNELVEKKLDIAGMLLSKCSILLSDPSKFGNHGSPVVANGIHLKAIKFLIENEADILATRDDGSNMLFLAAGYMSDENFTELCDYLNVLLYKGSNALRDLIKPELLSKIFGVKIDYGLAYPATNKTKRLLKIMHYLKEKFSSTNKLEESQETTKRTRFLALDDQSPDKVLKSLLDAEFYKNYQYFFSILFHAAIFEDFTTVSAQILNYDTSLVTITVRAYDELVPVLFSVDSVETFKFLVDGGANIFEVDTKGRTVLHFLAEKYKYKAFSDVIRYLGTLWNTVPVRSNSFSSSNFDGINKPRNLTELFNWPTNDLQQTPLHYVSLYLFTGFNKPENIDLLLSGGRNLETGMIVNINAVDVQGNTALLLNLESLCLHVEFVESLVNRGADISIKNNRGCNAAHICALHEQLVEHLKFFVKLGIDVNEIDSLGNNALQCGIANHDNWIQGEFIKILLDAKVDKTHRNHENMTAYEIAEHVTFTSKKFIYAIYRDLFTLKTTDSEDEPMDVTE